MEVSGKHHLTAVTTLRGVAGQAPFKFFHKVGTVAFRTWTLGLWDFGTLGLWDLELGLCIKGAQRRPATVSAQTLDLDRP